MTLDFDPLYHTATMVQILREQGSTQHAMELAQIILQREPENQAVAQILEELKAEARQAFERFKSGGRLGDVAKTENSAEKPEGSAPAPIRDGSGTPPSDFPAEFSGEDSESETESVSETEESKPAVEFTLVRGGQDITVQEKKILRLESLLKRIQKIRERNEASPA